MQGATRPGGETGARQGDAPVDPPEARVSSTGTRPRLSYDVDAAGCIVAVAGDWDAFARANDAGALTAADVTGQPLSTYLADAATRQLYELLLERVRRDARRIVVPIRCDAPDRRREIELELEPLPAGGVRFHSTVIAETPRSRIPLLDRRAVRSEDLLRMCCMCHAIATERGVWLDLEEAVERLPPLRPEPVPPITHGVCPRCFEIWERDVG